MSLLDDVLKKVKPGEGERQELSRLSDRLAGLTREVAEEVGVECLPAHVGSTSRGTWLSGDRDLDLFLKLPTSLSEEEFAEAGMEIARGVADHGTEWEESFAEHPYVKARFGEFDVDLVPCFDIDEPSEMRSSVDRTPFHDSYVEERIEGKRDDVLLLKQFMKGLAVYSAEARVRGFSGYLTELLVIIQRGFEGVVSEASGWRPQVTYDPEGHGAPDDFEEPLVVVDPVDPDRNVAAALSLRRFSEFVQAARDFLEEPGRRFFFPPDAAPPRDGMERGTYPILVRVDGVEGIVEDNLFPQMRRTEEAMVNGLEERGFEVQRSESYGDSIVLELPHGSLPPVELHTGPPAWVGNHARKFLEKYGDEELFGGPWIDDRGRLVVERSRRYVDPEEVLDKLISSGEGFGKTLARVCDFEIQSGPECWEEVPGEFLARRLPWRGED